MVNKVVLDYFKMHYGRHSIRDLKKNALSKGYPEKDIDDVINSLRINKNHKTPYFENRNYFFNTNFSDKKWMVFSGMAGLLLFFIGLTSLFFGFTSLNVFSLVDLGKNLGETTVFYLTLIFLLSFVFLSFLFYYGFFKFGKYFDNRPMKIFSILNFISILLMLIFGLFLLFTGSGENVLFLFNKSLNFLTLIFYVFVFLMCFLFSYIFALTIIKLSSKSRFSLLAGIIGLFSSMMWLVFIGTAVYLSLSSNSLFYGSINSETIFYLSRILWFSQVFYLVSYLFYSMILLERFRILR